MAVRVSVINPIQQRVPITADRKKTIRTVNVLPEIGSADLLSQLGDVTITNPANNHTLVYDASTEKFINAELPVINGGNF